MRLLTIGHSNHSIAAFTALLAQHQVTALADVRSHPYSRYLPHFNKAPLQATLSEAGIHYVFLGRELGARPDDSTCYIDGKAIHEKIASTTLFQAGIERLLEGAKKHTIALMCAEKDPITCHRSVLVCRYLRDTLDIHHILSNGDLEPHAHLEERLLQLHGAPSFSSSEANQLSLIDRPTPQGLVSAQTVESFAFYELPLFQYQVAHQARETLLEAVYRQQSDKIAYVEKVEA